MNTTQNRETFDPLRVTATQIGVPVRWLRSEAEAGRIPCLRAGGRMLFNIEQTRQALLKLAECSK